MNFDELKEIYAENIKSKRIEKKLKQDKLAEKIGLTEKYVSDLETGRRFGSFETLVAIANALDVEPYELLLPKNQTVNYDSRKTKQLMKQLRTNLSAVVDTMEKFLEDK